MRIVTAASRSSVACAMRRSAIGDGTSASTVDCTVKRMRATRSPREREEGRDEGLDLPRLLARVAISEPPSALRASGLIRARGRPFALIGIDDLLYEGMAYDVGAREAHERDAAHVLQHALGLDQPA